MGHSTRRWARLAYWNLWPALRLLLVMAALGVWAHRSFGLNLPSVHRWGEVAGIVGILFVFLALLFWRLARLCLALLWFPFYAVIVFNCLFYSGSCILVRQLIGPCPRCLGASLALAGELALFMSLAQPIALLLKTYGHF